MIKQSINQPTITYNQLYNQLICPIENIIVICVPRQSEKHIEKMSTQQTKFHIFDYEKERIFMSTILFFFVREKKIQ